MTPYGDCEALREALLMLAKVAFSCSTTWYNRIWPQVLCISRRWKPKTRKLNRPPETRLWRGTQRGRVFFCP